MSIRELELDTTLVEPAPLIETLLECGSKLMLVGSAKTYKSWNLLLMAMCLTTPQNTWFRMPVHQCRVLYVNFEIQKWFFRKRLRMMATAMGVDLTLNTHLDAWNLRGHSQDETDLVRGFKERLQHKHDYKLVIVDPFYKFSGGGRVENAAEDISSVMRAMDTVTVDLDVAVVFAHHSPKGDVSNRSVVDRGAGSGVFGRDPDAIVSILDIKDQPDNYIAEFALRNHPPKAPLGLHWESPIMRVDDDVEKPKSGRKPLHDERKMLALLMEGPLEALEWEKLSKLKLDISRATHFKLRKKLIQKGDVEALEDGRFRGTFFGV